MYEETVVLSLPNNRSHAQRQILFGNFSENCRLASPFVRDDPMRSPMVMLHSPYEWDVKGSQHVALLHQRCLLHITQLWDLYSGEDASRFLQSLKIVKQPALDINPVKQSFR
jgi:hypothetical protein